MAARTVGSQWLAKRYLLRDKFTTARAAGAVNGTPAEPGPGTRTVTDTESKLSITGNALTIAGGKTSPAFGDPGLAYPKTNITNGQVLLLSARFTTVGEGIFGYDTAATGITSPSAFYVRATGLLLYPQASPVVAATLSTATDYIFAIVARAPGFAHLIKTNTGPWILLRASPADTSTRDLYVRVNNHSCAGTFNSFRIPNTRWLPTPLAYDTFTRDDGSLTASETIGPDAQILTTRTWTNQIGTVAITGNVAKATALDGGIAIATLPATTANVFMQAALTRGTTGVGIVLRYVDTSNYVYALRVAANIQVWKVIAGTPTKLIDVAATEVAAANLVCSFDATKLRCYYNNALVGTEQTISDAAIQAADAMGLIFQDTNSAADTFTVWARGNEGQYAALDSM